MSPTNVWKKAYTSSIDFSIACNSKHHEKVKQHNKLKKKEFESIFDATSNGRVYTKEEFSCGDKFEKELYVC